MDNLIKLQHTGSMQIKPVDKGGGFAVMDLSDYLNEMSSQLEAKFTHENGKTTSFYEKCDKKALKLQENSIALIVEKGFRQKLISETDKDLMQPSGKPNRLYGLPKVHKGIQVGSKLPPCRPIVSNCGSNTDKISGFVDHYSKHLVKNLKSYVQDTPDFLRIIERSFCI